MQEKINQYDKKGYRTGFWREKYPYTVDDTTEHSYYEGNYINYEGNYINGKKDGEWTCVYKGVKVFVFTYKNDLQDGLLSFYDKNGEINKQSLQIR